MYAIIRNGICMLYTIAIILLILWLLGFVGFHVLGGFIHILLVVAIVLFLVRVIRGENPLK
jgi:asparagine N-glycosylation enzyme membrane subunit Stt3